MKTTLISSHAMFVGGKVRKLGEGKTGEGPRVFCFHSKNLNSLDLFGPSQEVRFRVSLFLAMSEPSVEYRAFDGFPASQPKRTQKATVEPIFGSWASPWPHLPLGGFCVELMILVGVLKKNTKQTLEGPEVRSNFPPWSNGSCFFFFGEK